MIDEIASIHFLLARLLVTTHGEAVVAAVTASKQREWLVRCVVMMLSNSNGAAMKVAEIMDG